MNWKKSWNSYTMHFTDWRSHPGVQKVKSFMQGKAFLSAAMVLLLGGAIGFHYFWTQQDQQVRESAASDSLQEVETLQDSDSEQETASVSQGVFDAFRIQREDTRSQEVEYLQSILQDEKTDEATRTTAQLQLSSLTDTMEKELTMETLIQAKGFSRVVALSHEDSLNIVVGEESLSEEQVAQILSVAVRESGMSADQIKIIPSVVE